MTGKTDQICTFQLGERRLAVDLSEVREVLREQEITPIPRTPESIAGLASLRGQIVTAVDLRTRFGLGAESAPSSPTHVVVEHRGSLYTLLVDEIGDIVDVDEGALGPVPENFDSESRALLDAVLEDEAGWILVADLEQVLAIEV